MLRFSFKLSPLMLLAAATAIPAGSASAANGWKPAATGSAAILPAPTRADGILGGSLFCREQRWSLLLRTDRLVTDGAAARITVEDGEFAGTVTLGPSAATIPVTRRLVEQVKDGSSMKVSLSGDEKALTARFSLADSRATLEAVAPLCSAPVMVGFEAVRLQPDGPAQEEARSLMQAELDAFRDATTNATPVLTAAGIEGEGGRRLLFASLCGSQRFYGESGCKLIGFASEASGPWRPVYDTEGMQLFRDESRAHGGWPDLLTLSNGGEPERLRWIWNGDEYEATDEAAVIGGERVVDGLRTGATAE